MSNEKETEKVGEVMPIKWQERIDQAEGDEASQEQAQEPEQEGPSTAEMIYPLCEFITTIACPEWEIAKKENEALAESYGLLLDKYFPNVASKLGVELNALLVTVAIFGPRVASGIPPRKKKPEPEKQAEGEHMQAHEDTGGLIPDEGGH